MAQVTIDFEDYQSGSLPDVCVLTGVATGDRMVLRTSIRQATEGSKQAGRVLGSLDKVFNTVDPRKAQNTLLGRLPVDRGALSRQRLQERVLRVAGSAAVLFLVVAAWAAASWSPVAVVLSLAAIVYISVRRRRFQGDVPVPTLIGAGSRVHLDNVHEAFAAAVESGR